MTPIDRLLTHGCLLACLLLASLLAQAAETWDDDWLKSAKNTLESTKETLEGAGSREIDPAQVAFLKKALLPTGAHELVIKESTRVSPPAVLITGFGDSAVNLELRCFIRNIDKRMQVFSDLCFAIDGAFRETGIQIPYPQQDLYVKEWPDRSRP